MSNVAAIRQPDPHTTDGILDAHGDAVQVQKGLMVKIDAKASERIEVSKGTMAAFSTVPALVVAILMLIFNYGTGLLGFARDDQAQKEQINTLNTNFEKFVGAYQEEQRDRRNEMKDMKDKWDEFMKAQHARDLKEAELRGVRIAQEANK